MLWLLRFNRFNHQYEGWSGFCQSGLHVCTCPAAPLRMVLWCQSIAASTLALLSGSSGGKRVASCSEQHAAVVGNECRQLAKHAKHFILPRVPLAIVRCSCILCGSDEDEAQRGSPGYQWSGTADLWVVARNRRMAQLSGITCAYAHCCRVTSQRALMHASGAHDCMLRGVHLVPGHQLEAGHLPQRVDLQELCSPLRTLQSRRDPVGHCMCHA